MFANLLHLFSRRSQPGYDQGFVQGVEAMEKPPRNRRLERQIWISWILIAVKSVLVVWAIRRFHIPFSPLWVIVPTVAFGALYTVVYCRAKLRAMDQSIAIIVMGVAGSGKTTVGLKLAAALGWSFHDADEFHPPENIANVAGIPLDDRDRAPWLAAMRAGIEASLARGESSVVACSALKEKYRAFLMADAARVKGVYLKGDFALILRRISQREGHFMKENMLQSQFEALEPPQDALTVDAALPPDEIVAQICRTLNLK